MGMRLRNRIKTIGRDPDEFEVRLNDHVTVDWTEEDDGYPQVYVTVCIGDLTVGFYCSGSKDPLSQWYMHDITCQLGEDAFFEEENIDTQIQYLPSLETWLKMAREKGAF